MSRTRLMQGFRSLKGRLAGLREAAEEGSRRAVIGGSAAGAGYVGGRIKGWAQRTGKDITIGDSETTYMLPAGLVGTVAGAFGTKLLGETTANVVFGAGIGLLAGELNDVGFKHGVAVPST